MRSSERTRRNALLLLLVPLALSGQAGENRYRISTIAGSNYGGDDRPALDAPLGYPNGVALDGLGNLILADTIDHAIRQISPDGRIHTIAGDGHPGDSGDGGPAATARLNNPYGIAVESGGAILVADLGNHRVRRIDISGIITTVAGGGDITPGTAAIPALEARLDSPRNLAVDNIGNIYISDFSAHRIYKVVPGGTLVPFAGTGVPGMDGDSGPALKAQLSSPAGLAFDSSGALYVADSGNKQIRQIDRGIISTLRLSFNLPTGVAFDSTGRLWIADGPDPRFQTPSPFFRVAAARDLVSDLSGGVYVSTDTAVRRLTADGNLRPVAGAGDFDSYGEGRLALEAHLRRPVDVISDGAGGYYIAEEAKHRVRHVLSDGTILTVAGTGVPGNAPDAGLAVGSPLNAPRGLALDNAGNLYISDSGSNRVRMVTKSGLLSTVATLENPDKLVFDTGILYVAETGANRIAKRTGGVWTEVAAVEAPRGLAIDSDGNLYTTSIRQVLRVRQDGIVEILASSDPLEAPSALAVSDSGQIVVSDEGAHRLWMIEGEGFLTAIAGTGAAGYSGEEGVALETSLDAPAGIAFEAGSIVLCDPGNNRVRKLTLESLPPPALELKLVNAASLADGPLAPGELVLLPAVASPDNIRIGGIPVEPIARQDGLLLIQVPAAIAAERTVDVEVAESGNSGYSVRYEVAEAAPGLYAANGHASVIHSDGTLNSSDNPARRGDVVAFFGTGEGTSGLPFSLRIGGVEANIVYAGPAPGFAGLFQVNVRVPYGFLPSGPVPVDLSVGAARSQAGVTMFLR